MTLELSAEEVAFLAGVMSVQGSFTRTGGAAVRIGWIVGAKASPMTITRVAELTDQRVRHTKRGDHVVVAGSALTELMEIVSEWLDPDRYDQYLAALEMAAAVVDAKREAHREKVALREARMREQRLVTRDMRRKMAEDAYYNQDPGVQVIEDNDVNENEVNREIARRAAAKAKQKDQLRRYN